MSASSAFSDEKGGSASEPEYGHDPASGGIFSSDYKRHDDLKEMLDSNKDSLKLEAMKRIVAMIARGKNTSDLFPAVVKNVACKNIEVKKLVYVYLVRYAEEQQDLALLSISTFQRGLKVLKHTQTHYSGSKHAASS
uniref:Clathrin/coatomer adaptor adaptin-like N-terminal domain-containing protein n=1 Tax=Sinocyclocheilus rhinocerous TaxID=307959 RepID=A0A673KY74_9TELE